MKYLMSFREIICLDLEFIASEGERPQPICLVARELRSGRSCRQWLGDDGMPPHPPFPIDQNSLLVAYLASAELGCMRVLNWQFPYWVLDLFAEFRVVTNGYYLPCGNSLLGALQWFGLDAMEGAKKDFLRKRILAGGPYSESERKEILDYCQSDVDSLVALLPKLIEPNADLRLALLRGDYMKTVALVEHRGIPINTPLFNHIKVEWRFIQESVVSRINETFPVFKGKSFNYKLFEKHLDSQGLLAVWPRTKRGNRLAVDEDTFREMARRYPSLEPLQRALQVLHQLHAIKLTVGSDGRNRCLLSPFATRTGRNAPSTTKNIFGAPAFLRNLVRPEPGTALAYVDWSQQEFGIAAALSGDPVMQQAYLSGDAYLGFAKAAKFVPEDATKESHRQVRELFKDVCLGVQYQMSAYGLMHRLECSFAEAQDLFDLHHRTFPVYWRWVEAASDYAQMKPYIEASFGWRLHFSGKSTPRSLSNWPMQANGAEMLRLACVKATQAGIVILCPVHDALLIEAPERDIDGATAELQRIMRQAGETVLDGFALGSEAQIIRPPHASTKGVEKPCGVGCSKH